MSRPNPEKVAREATRDFNLRRNYRAIRKAASVVDPNSGFRLSTKSLAAGGVAAAKEAGATRLPGKVYGH